MKKVVSLFLVLTLMLSLMGGMSLSAFASDEAEVTDEVINEVTDEVADEVTDEVSDEVADEVTDEVADEVADEVTDEVTDEVADEAADEVTDEVTDEVADEAADEVTDEVTDEVADEAADEVTDEVTDEVADEAADEAEEAVEIDAEELFATSGLRAEDTAASAGKTYVIGIKNDDGTLTVLKDNGGSVVVASIASISKADTSMQWLAASGVSLQNVANTGDYLYYGEGLIRSSAANNWSYASGTMKYDSKGTTYYLTLTAAGASVGTDSSAASTNVVLWSTGTATGGDSGSEGSGSDSGSSSGSGFTQTTKVAGLGSGSTSALFVDANGYPLFISDDGVPSCDGMALTMTGEAGSYHIDTDKPNIIWTVSEGNPPYLRLALDDKGTVKYLYIDDSGTVCSSTEDNYAFWNNGDGVNLSYNANGTTYYIASMSSTGITTTTDSSSALLIYTLTGTSTGGSGGGPGGPGGSTETVDEEAPVIVSQTKALAYVLENSNYPAPELSVSAKLAEGVTANNIYFQWYVDDVAVGEKEKLPVNEDGSPVTSTITLDSLKGKSCGVYNIYCEITCNIRDAETGEPVAHTTTSNDVSFIVCKGILENSFLTFSDVHQTWTNVGQAIADTIINNNGLIPALIICTGDWSNSHYAGGDETSENYSSTMSAIAKLYAQVSGIDIVFLSGNHDNGTAAKDATIDANLGAAADYNGVGVMYDSSAPTTGTSSKNKGLVVFGINYENLQTSSGGYSYESVLPELKSFLETLKADYQGELVVISSHTGLHKLADWGGQGSYNVDKSDEMVTLLNEYAKTMDIMFFFGHDHSKGETELFYKPGDPIESTISYSDKTTKTQTLGFSYGHAGYITNTIGGQERYSLVTWNNNTIKRTMSVVNGNDVAELTYSISRVAKDNTPDSKPDSKPDSTTKPSTSPKTGDNATPVLWVAVLILCAGSTVALLPRKKHN